MIEIYGKEQCGYCVMAKEELKNAGIKFKYYDIAIPENRYALFDRYPDVKTVPQIWNEDTRIGGYNELVEYLEE